MNFNTPNNTMSFQKFFGSAKRELILCQPFPYMIEICRCRYCLYSHEGKCSLKRCCYMEEKSESTLLCLLGTTQGVLCECERQCVSLQITNRF